eukprot:TRINITY_DN39_c2_g1_i1.p1 TRINITY_DN39_c2_g1~~TRINITY_DN39_c2_g1_i1.p1  ORF type:complete len:139 (-),score=54.31 TRINITY_DN39_c2_g1_i1:45-461(-)
MRKRTINTDEFDEWISDEDSWSQSEEKEEDEEDESNGYTYVIEEEEENKGRVLSAKEKNPPINSLILGGFLMLVGFILLIVGILILLGFIDTHHTDRGWILICLGCITFFPGSWCITMFLLVYFKFDGYDDYNIIPKY